MTFDAFRKRFANFTPTLLCSVAAIVVFCASSAFATVEEAQRYVLDAQKEVASGNLRAAEIQLRNAAQANPGDPTIHLELAQIYIALHNFPAAEAEARLARQDHASDDQVAPLLADAMLHEGKINPLLNEIRPGNRAPKSESAVRTTLGLAHLALQEFDKAEPLLRDAVRLDDQAVGPKIGLAQLFLSKGDTGGAEAQIKGALAVAPHNVEVLRLDGEILRAKGDLDGAMARINEALAEQPANPTLLLSRANLLVQRNDLDGAQRDIDKIWKAQPKNVPATYLAALIAAKKGNLKRADQLLDPISANLNAFPNAFYLEGVVKYGVGQYEQAEAFLTKFVAHFPNQPLGNRLLALIQLRKGNATRAIDLLKPVVNADPTDTQSATVLAQAYLAAKQPDKAVEVYEHVTKAQPSNADLQTQLAVMRMRAGETSRGLTDLESISKTAAGAKVAGPILILADLRDHKLAEAQSAAEALIKNSPDDPVAENLLGVVRVAQAKYSEAEQIYTGIIKKYPKFIAAKRNLAQIYAITQRRAEAKKILNEILEATPNDVPTLTALANLAVVDKDYEEAANLLNRAQQASPKDPAPGLQLIKLFASQKDWGRANSFGQQLLAQFSDNATVRDTVAHVLADSGDPKGAVTLYLPLLSSYPKSAEVSARFAALQILAGDKNGARQSIEKAIALAPNNVQYLGALVSLDYESKGVDAALATARSFAPKQQTASDLLVANVLVRAKRVPQAIEELTQAQKLHPASPTLIRLAELTYGAGNRQKAEEMAEAWLQSHDDAVDVRSLLAQLYLSQQDYKKAELQYEKVNAQAPNNAVALNNLAWLYAKNGNAKAEEFAERAYRLAPTPQVADTVGWILTNKGQTAKGLPYLEKAGAALPEDPDVQYHLAFALDASGAKDKARTVLERALKSGHDFESKKQAEKLLAKLGQG